ncbi:MAG: hypothetical protein LQ338_007413 [Usnochroma carphineum]|nr:MAG: hypothetical protein LQ338_007413 [Usnochroma carphineum]
MSFLSNPKVLYSTRLAQLVLGILFLVLICYDGTHRSWWTSINGALAVGVIASIFTLATTVYSIFAHHRSNPFSGGTTTITLARIAAEVLVFLLWVASAALMLRPRGGCSLKHTATEGTKEELKTVYCWDQSREHGKRYDDQPIKTWDAAIVVALIEA